MKHIITIIIALLFVFNISQAALPEATRNRIVKEIADTLTVEQKDKYYNAMLYIDSLDLQQRAVLIKLAKLPFPLTTDSEIEYRISIRKFILATPALWDKRLKQVTLATIEVFDKLGIPNPDYNKGLDRITAAREEATDATLRKLIGKDFTEKEIQIIYKGLVYSNLHGEELTDLMQRFFVATEKLGATLP